MSTPPDTPLAGKSVVPDVPPSQIPWGYGVHHPVSPLLRSAIGAAIATAPAFAIGVFVHFNILRLPPPAPMWPAGIAAILGAILANFVRWPARPCRIEWNGQELAVIDTHGKRQAIDPDSVTLIAGEAGISLHGGEMIQWKRVHVVCDGRRISVSFPQSFAELCFNELARICLNAICVSAWGKVQLGPPTTNDVAGWLGEAERCVRREFRRQSLRAFRGAIICAVGAMGTGVLAIAGFHEKMHEGDAGKAVVCSVVLATCAVLLFSATLRRLRRGRKVAQTLCIARRGQSVDPAVLDQSA